MSPTARGIKLRHLAFTGPGLPIASLPFDPGLNVVYGSSNTGKSFVAKALDFMLGGSRELPPIEERAGYDAAWLGLTLPDGLDVTLKRSAQGGHLALYRGLVTAPDGPPIRTLKWKHDPKAPDNVSMFLLDAIGFGVRWAVKNANGDKNTVSFRDLAPYVIVEEGSIIEERSPVLSGQHLEATTERNVLKVVLTGLDDSAVVSAVGGKELRTLNRGKLQIIDEMIEAMDVELGDAGFDREGLQRQTTALRAALALRTEALRQRQVELDAAVAERRANRDASEATEAHLGELVISVGRFEELDGIYRSDLQRLEALEENSFLLKTIHGRECPTCGALEEHQRREHGLADIEQFNRAADAEMRKVRRERHDLMGVLASLKAEVQGMSLRLDQLAAQGAKLDEEVERLRRQEASAREEYEAFVASSERVRRLQDVFARRDVLVARKSQLEAKSANRAEKLNLAVGVDDITAFAFAKVVERVLEAWGFPGTPRVTWNKQRQDIQTEGKDRYANGKGVRAVLHAAFKVALMIFCRDKNLPHPGFVVLDTPLLTYREPMEVPKHGELEEDERALKATGLNVGFYRHLASIASVGQIIVLENSDPPPEAWSLGKVVTFTKRFGPNQRYGYFPVGQERQGDPFTDGRE